jgi:hypothetical protein
MPQLSLTLMRFLCTSLLLLSLSVSAFGQAFTPRRAFLPGGTGQIYDTVETYTDNAALNSLNGGFNWNGAYADRSSLNGVEDFDTIESYTDAAALNGLNGGAGFSAAYVDRYDANGVQGYDTMESYADAAAVNGLNGGSFVVNNWNGAYVDR